jgi:hypothetical protein
MSIILDLAGSVWDAVLERFERHATAQTALEHALRAGCVDAVFEAHRQKQYARDLLFSTVIELTTLVVDAWACWTPTICRRARGALRRCVGPAVRRCLAVAVVYDPDGSLVSDLVACRHGHVSEGAAVGPLLDSAKSGERSMSTGIFAPAPRCKPGRMLAPVSLCASPPVILTWSRKGRGTRAAAATPARSARRRS